MYLLTQEVASACCLQGKNNGHLQSVCRDIVASACCLQGKNNMFMKDGKPCVVASACCLQGKNNYKLIKLLVY